MSLTNRGGNSIDKRVWQVLAGFTLVELLVVIAIITLLAALLLPAIKGARDKAKGGVCLNNIKQMAVAASEYADDNQDYIPSSQGNPVTVNWSIAWRISISPYLGVHGSGIFDPIYAQGVFLDPAAQLNPPDTTFPCRMGGYGWNYLYLGLWDAPGEIFHRADVPKPSDTLVMGDSVESGPGYAYTYLYAPSTGWPTGNRHYQGLNLLWADMHAAWMNSGALYAGAYGVPNWYYIRAK